LSSAIKLGEIIQTPTEITITDSWKFQWESAFLNTRGYFNSAQRCKALGINDLPLPFSLLGTMAIAFSVSNLSYFARVHLSFKNMFQNKAVLAGDTMRAMFTINDIERKKGGDGGQYCLTDSTHWMVNQHNEVVSSNSAVNSHKFSLSMQCFAMCRQRSSSFGVYSTFGS